jgi:hypothetical protein
VVNNGAMKQELPLTMLQQGNKSWRELISGQVIKGNGKVPPVLTIAGKSGLILMTGK